jgi:DNA invertase Pin-like site-specific DNA recombinase
MLIGYARVSTQDQTLALQKDALEKIGCKKIFTDTASGTKAERKGLDEAMEYVREGDTLVVWRLDRLSRSLKHLIKTITELNNRKIGFKSITENIDTTTSGGKLVFHIFGALAEFERDIIRERTNAGLQAAKSKHTRLVQSHLWKRNPRHGGTCHRRGAQPCVPTSGEGKSVPICCGLI